MDKGVSNDNVVVAIAKEIEIGRDVIEVDGIKVKIKPVSSSLISEVSSRIKDPPVPMVPNPDKDDRLEPNPVDPDYLRLVEEAQQKRGQAAADALAMFGFELADGLPKDDSWLKRLKWMERQGLIDLSRYDLEDDMEIEFVYKKFILSSNENIEMISRASGVNADEVRQSEATFQR